MEENKTENVEQEVTEEKAEQAATEEKETKADKKKVKVSEKELSELREQLAAADDKYMRLYAEYDNFRRRSQKEKEGIYADAYIDALCAILPVLDNLERAAAAADGDEESPMAKGLALTLKSFADTLAKLGVSEIPALGEKFDPNVHNAVMHIEDESLEENTVVEVFMKGYIKGDKVLRHSMVKVAN